MRLRSIIFWVHLATGLLAGVVIAIMSFTGAALAFEKEIIAWAERKARLVSPPAEAKPLILDELLGRMRDQQGRGRPSSITLYNDPHAAVLVSFGRTHSFYVDPYSGEVRPPAGSGVRRFMQVMTDWHRWLGRVDQQRAAGKAVTGAVNVALMGLVLTGLALWWPRTRSASAWRGSALLNWRLRGKARDWNWHNVIGLWSAPVLIVLTATALPMSYRWANNLIYRMTGNQPPAPGAGPGAASGPEWIKPAEGAKRLPLAELVLTAQKQMPDWQQITLRLSGGGRGAGAKERSDGKEASARGVESVTVSIKARDARPRFSSTQLQLDPYQGTILRQETFRDDSLARKIRSWTRFLHTGEALGWSGQALAGLASIAALVLVYTGAALAFRRFFRKSSPSRPLPAEPSPWN